MMVLRCATKFVLQRYNMRACSVQLVFKHDRETCFRRVNVEIHCSFETNCRGVSDRIKSVLVVVIVYGEYQNCYLTEFLMSTSQKAPLSNMRQNNNKKQEAISQLF